MGEGKTVTVTNVEDATPSSHSDSQIRRETQRTWETMQVKARKGAWGVAGVRVTGRRSNRLNYDPA
jgi:hypothetical protein